MKLTVLSVPYHLGREGAGMALGPARYLEAGLAARLAARGHEVEVVEVRRPGPFGDELQAVVAVNDALAEAVRAAAGRGALPVVAGGNCNVALGMTAGLGAGETAVVWFDAHGDYNTPATTPSGFLDGMPLAIACGVAHPEAWAQARGEAVDPRACVHAGGRDLDPGEVEGFAATGVQIVGVEALRNDGSEGGEGGLEAALAAARSAAPRAAHAYAHVDIDVLDPVFVPGVDYPSAGGLTPDELVAAVTTVAASIRVAGLSVTAYDPERDDAEGTTLTTGLDLIARLVDTVASAAQLRPRAPLTGP
ncbi:MAG: arginase family protein [Thermoleophilia bacterium]|nr:arginase family protein [Thermoleophilia bacterium]